MPDNIEIDQPDNIKINQKNRKRAKIADAYSTAAFVIVPLAAVTCMGLTIDDKKLYKKVAFPVAAGLETLPELYNPIMCRLGLKKRNESETCCDYMEYSVIGFLGYIGLAGFTLMFVDKDLKNVLGALGLAAISGVTNITRFAELNKMYEGHSMKECIDIEQLWEQVENETRRRNRIEVRQSQNAVPHREVKKIAYITPASSPHDSVLSRESIDTNELQAEETRTIDAKSDFDRIIRAKSLPANLRRECTSGKRL